MRYDDRSSRDRRRWLPLGVLLAGGLVLAACGGSGAVVGDADMVLDVETLSAETEFGQVQAQRADVSFVAALGDGRAIGITWRDQIGATAGAGDDLVVYVYERDQLTLLSGAVDADGSASLADEEGSAFHAAVDVTVGEHAVSGTVSFGAEEPVPFTAEVASGQAGVYWAHGAADNPDVTCDWVVLADGRQWGCLCGPPFTDVCCVMRM
jgi:hypothetical protein